MGRNGFLIDRLDEDRWALLAELRIAAIRDSPGAFLLDVGEEQRGEAEWRAQFGPRRWWVAKAGGRHVGIVSSVVHEGHRYVESMWVRPECRGRNIATGLLSAVEHLARRERREDLWLYVLEGNSGSAEFYRRLGFEATGRTGEVGFVRRCQEYEYRLPLPVGGKAVTVPEFVGR